MMESSFYQHIGTQSSLSCFYIPKILQTKVNLIMYLILLIVSGFIWSVQEIGFCKYIHDAAKVQPYSVGLWGSEANGGQPGGRGHAEQRVQECHPDNCPYVVQHLSQDQRRAGKYYHLTFLVPEHQPQVFRESVIFMGAIITHPPSRDNKKLSITAVHCPGRPLCRLQRRAHIHQARKDVIRSLSSPTCSRTPCSTVTSSLSSSHTGSVSWCTGTTYLR